MAMRKAYAERAMCDNFAEGEVWSFGVEVALDDLQIGGDVA